MLQMHETGYLRLNQIVNTTGRPNAKPPVPAAPGLIPVSRSTWLRGVAEGRFPKPIKLSRNVVAWRIEDVRELIERAGK